MLKKVILFGVSIGICLSQAQAQNYYKWVDSKGNTTYSSKPPPVGAKQQKIETLRSLGTAPAPQRAYSSQSSRNTQQQANEYQSSSRQNYSQPRQPERSAEDEALRQKAINEASKPIPSSRGLTANQRNAIAGLSSNNNPPVAPPSIANCDSAGCWGTDGTRYNKGAGNTYFPSTGGSCQSIGGQMQCN